MPSPFPGMDPFLEGYLWVDVHQALASKLREALAPRISPRYVARLAVAVVEDETGEAEIGVMYPDVEIIEPTPTRALRTLREAGVALTPLEQIEAGVPLTPLEPIEATPWVVVPTNLKYRQVTVEIRDTAKNDLVTSIEILSPVNKRSPGLEKYRAKRKRLYDAGVHLLEIDLLRRGTRALSDKKSSEVPYAVILTRAGAETAQVWRIRLQDKLPTVLVPLREDPDILLDLQAALTLIYDVARYDLTIDYSTKPPPPDLSPQEETWMRELLKASRTNL